MQRLKRGAGLFVFLGLVGTQAAAQEVPEQAQKEIAHDLRVRSRCSETSCRRI